MEWISVKKQLPKSNKIDVLVKTEENGNDFYHIANCYDGEWATCSEILHYVTHWAYFTKHEYEQESNLQNQ